FVLFYYRAVDAGNVVEPFGIGYGCHLGQIMISSFIFGEKYDLIAIVFSVFIFTVVADIELTSHDWLSNLAFWFITGGNCFLIFSLHISVVREHFADDMESSRPIAMVCQCQCRHVVFFRCSNRICYGDGGLPYRKRRVVM